MFRFERCVEEIKLQRGRVMNGMEYDKTYEELETFFPQRNAERGPQERKIFSTFIQMYLFFCFVPKINPLRT